MKSVDRPATAGTRLAVDRTMCCAVPRAALKGWRIDVGCASTANREIHWAGIPYPVCEMHRTRWERTFKRDGMEGLAALVREWGLGS